ncbi:hypothetical protein [Methylocaldum sp.]|uniref:hypothetical protein n=1 Tax=Methylocaldum sp. TaxID=1969727 RepID=UPI002D276036|nr:hypothetical protein [Methylocaldum sp.]HYE35386.1 hypothetical protein [Methylocaldum sp.]
MKHKTSFRGGGSRTTLITHDGQVRAMAKKAGVWALLREARQQKRSCLVMHGLTIFGACADGYAAFAASHPAELLEAFMRLSLEIGVESAEIRPTGERH